jgi:hypothetical protein
MGFSLCRLLIFAAIIHPVSRSYALIELRCRLCRGLEALGYPNPTRLKKAFEKSSVEPQTSTPASLSSCPEGDEGSGLVRAAQRQLDPQGEQAMMG